MAPILLTILKLAATLTVAVALLLTAGWWWQRSAEAARNAVYPAPGRMVDIGGRKLHLLCKGDAPGPTVVFEQGAGELSVYTWPVQDAVAGFARVCTYDRAGMGWSDAAAAPRSMADRVADLHKLLQAAHVPGPYVLVGFSYGGPMIALYARDYPAEIAGLVFGDTPDMESILGPDYQSVTRRIHLPMIRVLTFATRFGVQRLLAKMGLSLTPGSLPPDAKRAADAVRRVSAVEAAADDIASLWTIPQQDHRPLAPGALGARPVAVISHTVPFPGPFAALENGFAASQERLLALSSDSLHLKAEDAGHVVQVDAPQLVIDTIRRVHAAARDGMPLNGATISRK